MTIHRLLTGKRLSPGHFGRLTAIGQASSTSLYLRPFSMFCINQLALSEQKLRNARNTSAGTVFASSILSTFRPQSTTPDVVQTPLRECLQNKRKRYRQKFAELIQSKGVVGFYNTIKMILNILVMTQ